MNNKFSISLKTLYDQVGPNLKYGAYICKQTEGNNDYYDLLEAPPECNSTGVVLCDGETCTLLRVVDDQVLLKPEDSEKSLCLTVNEFEIASFFCNEQELIKEKSLAFCKEVALHFAYKITKLHSDRIVADDGKTAKLYESPMSFLVQHEEELIEHYATFGTNWNDVVEFIHTSIKKDTIDGIRHAHMPDGDNYWSVTHSINGTNFWLGRYDCIIAAILIKRAFIDVISAFDSSTARGMKRIALVAEEMVQTSLSESTKKMTPEELSSKLLCASCLEQKEFEAYCKKASELILDQQETIQSFISANEILRNNPLYQKHVDLWRKKNRKDKLSYPSGDQIYKDWWALLNEKEAK